MKSKLKGMNPALKDKLLTYAIVIVFFAVCGLLASLGLMGSLFKGLLVPMCYYIIMAVSLNLTVGILGDLSLGHAGFVCVGAYSSAIFSLLVKDALPTAVRFPLALLIGGLLAAIFGIIIGIPILRLKGDYLAIVTLAFGEIIRTLIQNVYIAKDVNGIHFSFGRAIEPTVLDSATRVDILNGPMAMSGVPKNATLLLSVILVLVTLTVVMNLVDSRTGRAIMAIRDNRIAADATGVSITKHKLIVFAVSAFFAGIAGVLYSHYSTVTPAKFDFNMSILILVFVVLGKIGNIRGSAIAAVLLYALPELLRGFQNFRMLIYAVILILAMLLGNDPRMVLMRQKLALRFRKAAEKGGN